MLICTEAASLMGTSMAGFVRAAAKEKARWIIDQESRLIVDAKDADAKSFYVHFGFVPYSDRPLSLYLVMGL